MKTILVTGGAGYIGSHVCKALKRGGYLPVTFDNLRNGHKASVLYGPLFEGDIRSEEDLSKAFKQYIPDAVIHLAGSIDLRESIKNPSEHYSNNVLGTLTLANTMVSHNILHLVFSSSAAVYATPQYLPIDENHSTQPLNPYGRTKKVTEELLLDFDSAYGLRSACLRYFNAAGADPDAEIGEAHSPETHLIPRLILAAQLSNSPFTIYNDKLDTPDGTAIRDYVHVSDLAKGHLSALDWLCKNKQSDVFNLGTGRGYSVRQVIEQVEQMGGAKIPIIRAEKQIAELPILVADPLKAKEVLGWSPAHSDLETIIETAWKWHESKNLNRV